MVFDVVPPDVVKYSTEMSLCDRHVNLDSQKAYMQ